MDMNNNNNPPQNNNEGDFDMNPPVEEEQEFLILHPNEDEMMDFEFDFDWEERRREPLYRGERWAEEFIPKRCIFGNKVVNKKSLTDPAIRFLRVPVQEEMSKNEGVPTGKYVRTVTIEEAEYLHVFQPCSGSGANRSTHEVNIGNWFRVFLVTKSTIYSRYITNDWYALPEAMKYFPVENQVFKKLKRDKKRNEVRVEEEEVCEEDMQIFGEAQCYNEGLLRARDYDRSKNRFIFRHGGLMTCQAEEGCDMFACCACLRCVYHCVQGEKCDLPNDIWNECQADHSYMPKKVKLPKNGLKKVYRRFLKEKSGPAHSWFIPDSFTSSHDVNFNFPFFDHFIEGLKAMNATIPWAKVVKDFCFMVAHMFSGNKTTIILSVTHFITQLPVVEGTITQLLNKIPAWFESNAQSASVEGLFVPLLTLAGVVFSTLGLGKLPSDKSITDFIMRLSKIGSCIKSLETMKEYIRPAMEAVVDYVRVNFFGYTSTDLNAWKAYEDYCDEIQNLNNTGFEEKLKTEKNLLIQIDDLLMRGDNLMKTLDQLRVPANQRTRFNAAYAWLGRMRNEAAHCSAGKHVPRVPPVIFHFVGKTGVGKSEATSLLNARLLTKLGHKDENDLYTKVYYRDAGQERFDGYNSCVEGVVVDDFGSRVDSAANPSSEPFEVIRMQNSAVWQLPMASLAEKGSTFFRAKYVIWTSNQSTFKFESITNPEAVLRRVTLKFTQYPRPEFETIRIIGSTETVTLDHDKVAKAAISDPHIYEDVWLFDLVDAQQDPTPADSSTGGMRILKKGLSFEEVAVMCENALMRAQEVGEKKLAHTAEYFKRCVENQGKAQGCDWFGFFGKDVHEGFDWEHVDFDEITEKMRWNGSQVGPHPLSHAEVNRMDRRAEYERFMNASCVEVRGPLKVQERVVRAYVQAMSVAEGARLNGTDEEMTREIFGKVFASYNIPLGKIRECTRCGRESAFWERYHRIVKKCRKAYRAAEERLEDWKPVINMAFEVAINLFISTFIVFLFVIASDLLQKAFIWLFPSLDPERNEMKELLAEVEFELEGFANPPPMLTILRENLQYRLGQTKQKPTQRCDTLTSIKIGLKQFRRDQDRKEGSRVSWELKENFESFQDRTQGVKARNVESHQDRTRGTKVQNVESHQDRTQGAKVKNVESHQDRTRGVRDRNVESGAAEATNDLNAVEIAYKVKRNLYGVEVMLESGNYFVGNLLFVVGKVAITNRHIYKQIKGRKIRIFNSASRKGFVLTPEQTGAMNASTITEGIHGNKDVTMIEMPRQVLVHADLTHFFMTKGDFARHSQLEAVCLLGFGSDLELQHRYSDKCQAIDKVEFKLIEQDATKTDVREWFRYGVHSRPGDCGSVAIAYDPTTARKLMGIHMAGYDSEGYRGVAVAVHQELLQTLMKGLKLENAESLLDGEFALEGERTEKSFGDFVNYGSAMAKSSSMATVIRPGPVYGMIAEAKTAPAKLRPFKTEAGIVDPLEMARKKADTENVPVDNKILKQCSQHYGQLLMDLKRDDRDDTVLTWEESIVGKEDPFYNPIKRNTSPGYGWEGKGKGKEPWLGTEENYIVDHPEVIAKRDEMMERINQGKRASAVFVDTLKDERRKLDRVEAGKTRLFAAGEMVFCLLVRQYFAGFSAHIMRNCVEAESTVGINPFGNDWSVLAGRLKEMGPHVVAGDFSNYDGTLNAAILWECLDVIEMFYENGTEEDRKIRRALWCELVNSVHYTVPFDGTNPGRVGYLYQWSHSQPSGNPLTVILNSVYHSIVARYVFKVCARKYCPEKVSLDNWDRYVRHNNYGDDDVTNIHPEIIEWFNQLTMTEGYLEIGMVYTDEAKSGDLVRSRRLEDIGFLKRSFRWDANQGRWRCPHSMDVILEMAMWVKRGANVYQLTAEVIEEAVHELAQHTQEVFNEYLPTFLSARRAVVPYWPCSINTYEEYEEVDMVRMGWLIKPDIRAERMVDEIFH